MDSEVGFRSSRYGRCRFPTHAGLPSAASSSIDAAGRVGQRWDRG